MIRTLAARRGLVGLATLLLGVLLPAAVAPAAQLKRYPIAGRGTLELQLPDGWVGEVRSETPSMPPTLELSAPGSDFTVLVAPLPTPQGAAVPPPERIRAAVEAEAASPQVRERAAEPKLAIEELRGPQVVGYHFSATDKTWKPGAGEYHYIVQGEMVVGSLVVTFTILTNAPGGPDRAAALEMLRAARFAVP